MARVQETLFEAFISIGTPNTALTLCITCGLAHTCSHQAHKQTGPPPTHTHLFTLLWTEPREAVLCDKTLRMLHCGLTGRILCHRDRVSGYLSRVWGPSCIQSGDSFYCYFTTGKFLHSTALKWEFPFLLQFAADGFCIRSMLPSLHVCRSYPRAGFFTSALVLCSSLFHSVFRA